MGLMRELAGAAPKTWCPEKIPDRERPAMEFPKDLRNFLRLCSSRYDVIFLIKVSYFLNSLSLININKFIKIQ